MSNFNKIGIMVDCSRNAVPTVVALKMYWNIPTAMIPVGG